MFFLYKTKDRKRSAWFSPSVRSLPLPCLSQDTTSCTCWPLTCWEHLAFLWRLRPKGPSSLVSGDQTHHSPLLRNAHLVQDTESDGSTQTGDNFTWLITSSTRAPKCLCTHLLYILYPCDPGWLDMSVHGTLLWGWIFSGL